MKEEQWWEKSLREQRNTYDTFKDVPFSKLIETVAMTHDKQWNHPPSEDIFREFNLYTGYETDCEVKFLTVRPTAFSWICTDTRVGVSIIFYVNEDGSETPIGVMEQAARKSDEVYRFISLEWMNKVRSKLIDMLMVSETYPPLVSFDDTTSL